MKVTTAEGVLRQLYGDINFTLGPEAPTVVWGIRLKPCPFCGYNPKLEKCTDRAFFGFWRLECCITLVATDRKSLAGNWNRRQTNETPEGA